MARANRAFAIFWGSLLALDAIGFLVALFGTWTTAYAHIPWYWAVCVTALVVSLYQILATWLVAWLMPYPDRWYGYGRYAWSGRTELYRLDANGKTFNVDRRHGVRGTETTDKVYRLLLRVTGAWYYRAELVAEVTALTMLFAWLITSASEVIGSGGVLLLGIVGFVVGIPTLFLTWFALIWGNYEQHWAYHKLSHFGDRD